MYTWDYHSSVSFWSGLKVQPIFVDEVQTFKALITVHKVLQEGHPVVRVVHHISAYFDLIQDFTIDHQGGPRSDVMARDLLKDCQHRWCTRYATLRKALNVFHDLLPRIRTINPRICSIHSGQAQIPSLTARVQRFVRVRGIYFTQGYR